MEIIAIQPPPQSNYYWNRQDLYEVLVPTDATWEIAMRTTISDLPITLEVVEGASTDVQRFLSAPDIPP